MSNVRTDICGTSYRECLQKTRETVCAIIELEYQLRKHTEALGYLYDGLAEYNKEDKNNA